MSSPVSKNPLVEKIVNGTAGDELLMYLLSRQLAFTEEEYLISLVFVLQKDTLKQRALDMLHQVSFPAKKSYIQKKEANHRVAYFLMLEALAQRNSEMLVAVVQNSFLPPEFLLKVAETGPAPTLEALVDNQIRLIAYPEIMDVMEKNPEMTPFLLGKIQEIRNYYLQQSVAEEIPEAAVLPELTELISEEEKKERAAATMEEDAPLDIDSLEVQKKALTTLQKINKMSVSERIKVALTGGKTERIVLIKDANRMVQMAVIESPKLSDDEVLIYTKDKSLSGDIISKVANNRDWTKNYSIIFSLIENPKTPISRALGFIKQLHDRDLKLVTQDKNINPVIRTLALNFLRNKNQIKT